MAKPDRELREELILRHFRALIEERGFFDLRVSELAKRAGISVGTLYSHFPCKEDLLMALAMQSASSRSETVRSALEQAKTPAQRFILATIVTWRFAHAHPSLMELEFLAMTPAIWKRASARFHQAYAEMKQQAWDFFESLLHEAFGEKRSTLNALYFGVGRWSLALGMDMISFSEFSVQHISLSADEWEQCQLDNVARLLVGWGWSKKEVDSMVESGLEIARELDGSPAENLRAS